MTVRLGGAVVAAVVACSGLFAGAASAIMTMRADLTQIASAADRVFVGRVTSVQSGRDASGLPSTWVTFAVSQTIKGRVGGQVSIKQFGVAEPLADGTAFRFPGVPTYKPGEEMVLFLSGESDRGFCSPIALGQGKFPIVRRAGRAFVTATGENAGALSQARILQRSTAAAADQETDLDAFVGVVKQLLANKGK